MILLLFAQNAKHVLLNPCMEDFTLARGLTFINSHIIFIFIYRLILMYIYACLFMSVNRQKRVDGDLLILNILCLYLLTDCTCVHSVIHSEIKCRFRGPGSQFFILNIQYIHTYFILIIFACFLYSYGVCLSCVSFSLLLPI